MRNIPLIGVDPDGDVLSYARVGAEPAWATVSGPPWTVSLAPPLKVVPEGSREKPFSVTVEATDGVLSIQESFNVTVEAMNQAPTLEEISSVTLVEGDNRLIPLVAGDPNNDPLTISVVNGPGWASISENALALSPSYELVTRSEAASCFSFLVRVSDGWLYTERSITVQVEHSERPPLLMPPADHTLMETQYLSLPLRALDPDGDTLTFSRTGTGPVWATVAGPPWTLLLLPPMETLPVNTHVQIYTVGISVSDGISSVEENLAVTVEAYNRAPLFLAIEPLSIAEGESRNIPLAATDADGDTLSYQVVAGPDWAHVSGNALVLSPSHELVSRLEGQRNFNLKVRVSDWRDFDEQLANVTVTHVNRSPTLGALPGLSAYECTDLWVPLPVRDADAEDHPLAVTLGAGAPPWLTLDERNNVPGLSISPGHEAVSAAQGISLFEVALRAADSLTHAETTVRITITDNPGCGQKSLGENCLNRLECQSEKCVDHVCCDGLCAGTCKSCNLPGGPGRCTTVTAGEDPGTCEGPNTCTPLGACGLKKGQACTNDAQCASTFCTDGVCCEMACDAPCRYCARPGSPGTCGMVANTGDTGACEGPNTCDAFGVCIDKNLPGSWQYVGSAGFSADMASLSQVAVAADGTLYAAFRETNLGDSVTVMKYNGPTWELVGSRAISPDAVGMLNLDLTSLGMPYIGYRDKVAGVFANRATVQKYNGSSWELVGSRSFSTGEILKILRMAIGRNDVPQVLFTEGSGGQATAMNFNGNDWALVGVARFNGSDAGGGLDLAVDSLGLPYAAFMDLNHGNRATVMKFNGTVWEAVGTPGFSGASAVTIRIALDANDMPYVAYTGESTDQVMHVQKFDGARWDYVGASTGFSAGPAFNPVIAIAGSEQIYVSYRDGANDNKGTVQKWESGSWQTVGIAGFTPGLQEPDPFLSVSPDGTPYVTYTDANAGHKASVMKYVPGALKKSLGATCGAAGECLSNVCKDGVCCNEACDGSCRACKLSGSEGLCGPVHNAEDPDTCSGTRSCDGNGVCL